MKVLFLILFSIQMKADVITLNLDNDFLDVKVENEFERKIELKVLVDSILKSGRLLNPEAYSDISDVFIGSDLKEIPIILNSKKISLNDVFGVLKDAKIDVKVDVVNRDLFVFKVSRGIVHVKISGIPEQILSKTDVNDDVKNWLKRKGVELNEGEDVRFLAASKVLLVSASRCQIRLIESVLELEANLSPKE